MASPAPSSSSAVGAPRATRVKGVARTKSALVCSFNVAVFERVERCVNLISQEKADLSKASAPASALPSEAVRYIIFFMFFIRSQSQKCSKWHLPTWFVLEIETVGSFWLDT